MQTTGRDVVSYALALVLALLSFTVAAAEEPGAEWQALEKHMQDCTRQFGYDPAQAGGLGAHELGAGERAWRDCVYEGIQKIMMSVSVIPEVYQQLIDDDRRMTDDIERQEMTRSERRAQLEANVRNIKLSEEVNKGVVADQKYSEMQQQMQRMQQMQQFERLVTPRIAIPLGR